MDEIENVRATVADLSDWLTNAEACVGIKKRRKDMPPLPVIKTEPAA